MGTLYIVSTPIGNMRDLTIRAIQTLFKVEYIACEDTRRTSKLLHLVRSSYADLMGSQENLSTKPVNSKDKFLISYYEENEAERIPQILNVLKNGFDVALVSDAGTPLISDPGFKLVRQCIKEGIRVESIPGPSSLISALVVSGLPTDKFTFVGYPPEKPGHRQALFHNIALSQKYLNTTVILFEAPHKLNRVLEELQQEFGDIEIVICRELTKVYEEVLREKISESLLHFGRTAPKGEFVLLFHI